MDNTVGSQRILFYKILKSKIKNQRAKILTFAFCILNLASEASAWPRRDFSEILREIVGWNYYNTPAPMRYENYLTGWRYSPILLVKGEKYRQRCRLVLSWRWRSFQGLDCSSIKRIRELGSERRETAKWPLTVYKSGYLLENPVNCVLLDNSIW